jgi:V-type H+-transporting ATPase subunit a
VSRRWTRARRRQRRSHSRHFNHRYAIYLEFVPQLLFLVCIFFYLIILIFFKWTHYDGSSATEAPSLLIRECRLELTRLDPCGVSLDLINMILLSYPDSPDSSRVFYSGQRFIQTVLLLLAVLCVPWMLLGKPIYRIVMNKRRANVSSRVDVLPSALVHVVFRGAWR